MNTRQAWASCVVLTLSALLLQSVAVAEPVTPDQLKPAVTTWVQRVTADARPDATIDRIEAYGEDGKPAAYIVHLTGGGYCLCGADDRLLPVYHYRPIGTYDASDPNYAYILGTIAKRLRKLDGANADELAPYQSMLKTRADQWRDLMAGRTPPAPVAGQRDIGPSAMSLRVRSAWHQGSPYNDYCPELIPGGDQRAVVGCVATTASQIMYYWNWPSIGTGSDSVNYNRRYLVNWISEPLADDPDLSLSSFYDNRLYWTPSIDGRLYAKGYWDGSIYWTARSACNGGVDCENEAYRAALEALWDRFTQIPETCYADFGASTYNFNLMKDSHADPATTGSLETAKLCHHAGIAVGMGYGVFASSAGLIRDGIVSHFRYHSDANDIQRNTDLMVEEIRWLRPCEIAGSEPGVGGHSWITCGYNLNTNPVQFLMNMGWGGGSTDWYSVDEVFPDNQWNTIRVAPSSVVRFVGGWQGDGRPSQPYTDLPTALEEAPENTKLIMYAGSYHTLPSSGGYATLSRPMLLTGHDVTIDAQ